MGQGETPGAPPGRRPDPSRPPDPAPAWPQQTRPWPRGKEWRPTNVLTSLGVARPGLLVFTSGHQSQADLFLPWSSKAACPWRPMPSPWHWVHRLPPRRHRHCRPAVGNRRPSVPTLMPFTGTTAPATGPSAGPGSGVGAGQQQSKRSMAPVISVNYFFSSDGRFNCRSSHQTFFPMAVTRRPLDLGGQSHPHRPPVTTSRRHTPLSSPPGPRHGMQTIQGRAASPLGLLWPLDPTGATTTGAQRTGPRPPALAAHGHRPGVPGPHHRRRRLPFTVPPLPGPRGKPGDGTPTPRSNMPRPEIFSKNHSRE